MKKLMKSAVALLLCALMACSGTLSVVAENGTVENVVVESLQNEVEETTSEVNATLIPEVSATSTPEVSETPTPEASATSTPEVSETPAPEASAIPEVSENPAPEASATPTPEVSETPAPEVSATPEVSETPAPEESASPEASEAPAPEESASPETSATPTQEESASPEASEAPAPKESASPEASEAPAPKESASPETSETPTQEESASPEASVAPEASVSPEASVAPEASVSPEASAIPEVSATPEASTSPEASVTPENGVMPEASATPEERASLEVNVTLETTSPQVGDIVWIKRNSQVLKNYTDSVNGTHTLLGNYEVKIKQIILDTDGTPTWYEFEFTSLGVGEAYLAISGYKYVEIKNTSKEVPSEPSEPSCSCGTDNGVHAEGCPFYEDDGFDIVYVQYEGTTASGISANISAPEGAFTENVNVAVTDTIVTQAEVESVIEADMDICGISAVDISFGGEQPVQPVVLKLDFPEDEIPSNANMVVIVHMDDDGPEVVNISYLDTSTSGQIVSFVVDGFSSYAAVFVNEKYNAQKMSSILANQSRYSLVDFNVDLFDYDPATINDTLNSVTGDGEGFHFTGYNIAGMGSNDGINNSEAEFAKQGIVEDTLVNGLPVYKYLDGTDAGKNTGLVLFSDESYKDKKTIYNDIPFEFVYDKQTGYYEYKSSANHAQLNDDDTKIELYADTLSTNNVYTADIDVSNPSGKSSYVTNEQKSTPYKGTAIFSGSRMDPYVTYPVSDVAASDVNQIYVKAKIPAKIKSNTFAVYFTTSTGSWSEDRTFRYNYTATGDWIEFVIDTTERSDYSGTTDKTWAGTITGIRIDPFDSTFGTLSGTYEFEIAEINFIKTNDTTTTRGGFYPFSDIRESYPGNNTAFNFASWENLIGQSGVATARASRSIFNPSPVSNDKLYEELAYGMVMEFDFYLPVDRSGEALTYYFNGDDDLWVFVDDKLVLDIGGGHGAITGTVNFTTGAVEVEKARTVDGYNSNKDDVGKKTGTVAQNLMSAGKHTMKIFYLERGGSVSNCYMKFNLPQTPQGSVKVSKEVVEYNNADTSVLYNESFEFQITVKNAGAGDNQSVSPLKNQEFYIIDGDETIVSKTDDIGKFTLKHGQEAIFDVDENYDVTLSETEHIIEGYTYKGTTVNGTNSMSLTQKTLANQEVAFRFVNTYEEQNVTITYIPVNPDACPENGKGTVELTGKEDSVTSLSEGISEKIGKRTGVPDGSTARETIVVDFVGWYYDPECTQSLSGEQILKPQKAEGKDVWEDRIYYAKFEYAYGDLTINKTGISENDHHNANGTNKEEKQSTVYTIRGTSYAGDVIDMEVIITGNSSITIKQLPAGEYTVTENVDWSWRYHPESNNHSVTVLSNENAKTTFKNVRDDLYWLSGDCWCENWWGGENGNVVERDEINSVIDPSSNNNENDN